MLQHLSPESMDVTSRAYYRSNSIDLMDLLLLIPMSGTRTITVDLANAPHTVNRVNNIRGIGFDEDAATPGIVIGLAEHLIQQCVRPTHKRGYVANGILRLVEALGTPDRTPCLP